MHICFLTHEYPKDSFTHGGVGTFVRTLSKRLVKHGIDVTVVGVNYTNNLEIENDEGVVIYRIPFRKVRGLTWLISSGSVNKILRRIHKKKPFDIIEATELGLAFISKIKGIKYIIRLHGGHHFFAEAENRGINHWKGFQEKISFKKADKIIGVSNYVLDATSKYIKFDNKRGPSIYNPVDLRRFYSADPQKEIRGRIFFAGTVCEKKGVRQLIMALPLIRKEIPEAHLVIAGRDWKFPDGSSYTAWVQQFIDVSVRGSITFLGPVEHDKIPGMIESSEVCVYPSHMEAMPLSWLEVLAMGKAFIGSKLGPGPEVIRDGVTGLLCNPLDPKDIAEKTLQILKNPALKFKLG
ncbi:MAG: glycosyltransferase family 4 protein, partial [Candidatus Methanofastidiosa archaeon]|nr:glycosyltransferase family 4 protein [Candidatus Methanofastidiosa archaeon]